MDLVSAKLPIACVEGWSTTQDLDGREAGRPGPPARASRTPPRWTCAPCSRRRPEQRDAQPRPAKPPGGHAGPEGQRRRSLAGSRLPGPNIVPALPGVHCTKWVGRWCSPDGSLPRRCTARARSTCSPCWLSFAIAAYALSRALEQHRQSRSHPAVAGWLDRGPRPDPVSPLRAARHPRGGRALSPRRRSRLRIAVLNHLRFPGLHVRPAPAGLVSAGRRGPAERGFMRTTGLSNEVYFGRWLWLTAALFAASAAVFAARLPHLRRRVTPPPAGASSPPG